MKHLIFIVAILSMPYTFGQQFKILEKSDLYCEPQYLKFVSISEETPVDQTTFVATFRVEGALKYMLPLYYQIKNKAQKLGANSFRFRSFRKLEKEKAELIVETYFNDESFFETNALHVPVNTIFVFGKPNFPDGKTQTLNINGEDQKIGSGKYMEIALSEEIKLSKGGFAGSSMAIAPNSPGLPLFFILSGSRISGGGNNSGGIGLSFNGGGMEQLEENLGLLLLKIYEKN